MFGCTGGYTLLVTVRGSVRDMYICPPIYSTTSLRYLRFLPNPHVSQTSQSLIIRLVRLKTVQCLPEYLLHAHVFTLSQQLFHRAHKFLIHIPCKAFPWVIRKYPHKHDCVILDVGSLVILFREELAYPDRSFRGGSWTRFGCFDNDR